MDVLPLSLLTRLTVSPIVIYCLAGSWLPYLSLTRKSDEAASIFLIKRVGETLNSGAYSLKIMTYYVLSFLVSLLPLSFSLSIEWAIIPSTIDVNQSLSIDHYQKWSSREIVIHGMRSETETRQLLIDTRGWGPKYNLTKRFDISYTNFTLPDPSNERAGIITKWWQVGYVYCRETIAYPGSGGGWRPDPLFEPSSDGLFLESEITQSIWLSFTIPTYTTAGTYRSILSIIIDGLTIDIVPVTLTVWDITLPSLAESRFDPIFSYGEGGVNGRYGNRGAEISKLFVDELIRQRIAGNHLYSGAQYDWSTTIAESDAGVRLLTLYDINNALPKNEHSDNSHPHIPIGKGVEGDCPNFTLVTANEAVSKLEPIVNQVINNGILQNVVVYGFDETPPNCVDSIKVIYSAVKKKWPTLKTAATLNWIPSTDLPLDIWIIHYNYFNATLSSPWLLSGRKQFWYHSIVPGQINMMNSYIERPLMEIRLMLWYAASYKVKGWLYYSVVNWYQNGFMTPLNNTARTSFDPASARWSTPDQFANGDGNFLYPGPNGPISTTRLHNFRDAFEDVELFRMLPLHVARQYITPLVVAPDHFKLDPLLMEQQRIKAAEQLIYMNNNN